MLNETKTAQGICIAVLMVEQINPNKNLFVFLGGFGIIISL
jgi:hypothetical protein